MYEKRRQFQNKKIFNYPESFLYCLCSKRWKVIVLWCFSPKWKSFGSLLNKKCSPGTFVSCFWHRTVSFDRKHKCGCRRLVVFSSCLKFWSKQKSLHTICRLLFQSKDLRLITCRTLNTVAFVQTILFDSNICTQNRLLIQPMLNAEYFTNFKLCMENLAKISFACLTRSLAANDFDIGSGKL